MKKILIITALIFPLGSFAQQNGNDRANPPAQIQSQNINFFDNINDDVNPLDNQQANPPAQNKTGSTGNQAPCADCDKIKNALKAAHSSGGGGQQKRSFNMKRWSRIAAGRMHMKMKRSFSRTHKVKTNYAICFNWH